jgi:hypothetical protein
MMRMVDSITIPPAHPVTTFSTVTTAHGITMLSTVQVVTITMSGIAQSVILSNGMAMGTTVRIMERTITMVQSIVIRTDLAHTSLAKVNTTSALS